MKKISQKGLPSVKSLIIVGLLFLATGSLTAAEPNTVQLIEQLRKENLELKASLALKDKELETAKADFFEAFRELKKHRDETARLRLQAAAMLLNKEALENSAATRLLLKDLQKLLVAQAKVHKELLELGHYLDVVLDTVGEAENSASRKNVQSKIQFMIELNKLSGLMGAMSKKNSGKVDESRVLDVNERLRVVILNVGQNHGVVPGMTWSIKDKKEKLLIVESRLGLSAATVVEGKLKNIVPGMLAKRQRKETLER